MPALANPPIQAVDSPRWVQGQRTVQNQSYSITWMELLYRRVTTDFAAIPTGTSTKFSEERLGWDPHTYFYVERPHPIFGDSAVAYLEHADLLDEARVSPFDTGGVCQGYASMLPELSDLARTQLVNRESHTTPAYREPFASWVSSSFELDSTSGSGGLDAYRLGGRPSRLVAAELHLETCHDRDWTWEGRLPKAQANGEHVTPIRVFLLDGSVKTYLQWLRDAAFLDRRARLEHLDWAREHMQEAANPVAAMIEFLSERGGD